MFDATLSAQTPLQRLVVEKALILARELEVKAMSAAAGTVVDACEEVVMGLGRQFLLDSLGASLQARADAAQKKGLPPGPAAAAGRSGTRAARNGKS